MMNICALMQSVSGGTADKANIISGWQSSTDMAADLDTASFFETVRQLLGQTDSKAESEKDVTQSDSRESSALIQEVSLFGLLENVGADGPQPKKQSEIDPELYAAQFESLTAIAEQLTQLKTILQAPSSDSEGTASGLVATLKNQIAALETAVNESAAVIDDNTRKPFVDSLLQVKTMMDQYIHPVNTKDGKVDAPPDVNPSPFNRNQILEKTYVVDPISHQDVDAKLQKQVAGKATDRAGDVSTDGRTGEIVSTKQTDAMTTGNDGKRFGTFQDNGSDSGDPARAKAWGADGVVNSDKPVIQAWVSLNDRMQYRQESTPRPFMQRMDSQTYPPLARVTNESGVLKAEATAPPRSLTATTVPAQEGLQIENEKTVPSNNGQHPKIANESADLPHFDAVKKEDSLSNAVSASVSHPLSMDKTTSTAETVRPLSIPVADDTTFQKSVFDQIVEKITFRTANDRSEMRIQLKPETLGDVRMRVMAEKNQLVVHMIADKVETKEIIESQIHHLKAELDKQGLTVAKIEVMIGTGHDQQESRGQFSQMLGNHSNGNGKRQTSADQESARKHQNTPDKESESAGDGINYFA